MKVQEFVLIKNSKATENNEIQSKSEKITNKEKILQYAYSLEANSNHPISNAIIEYAKENKTDKLEVEGQKEIAGCGIYGKIEGKEVVVGNKKMLDKYKISVDSEIENLKQNHEDSNENGKQKNAVPENAILIAVENDLVAYITLSEKIREGFKETLSKLYETGIKKVVMLTGDSKTNAEKIAKACGEIEYRAKLMPKNKVEEINKLKEEGKVIFIGDGINDSPVLATSDFSIAMGEGTDIASTTADSILISNNISSLPQIIKVARKTIRIVNENITISLLAKLIVLILGILGIAPVWLAVAADTGITLLTVINSIRIFKK